MKEAILFLVVISLGITAGCSHVATSEPDYQGKWVDGNGDTTSLRLIDKAFESLDVSAEMASLALMMQHLKRSCSGCYR